MTNDSAILAKIEHALKSAKPGLPAQLKMMPYPSMVLAEFLDILFFPRPNKIK
jgi:hypothetical protein